MRSGYPIGTPNRSKIDAKVHQASPKATFGGKVNAISPIFERFNAKQTVALRDPGPAPPRSGNLQPCLWQLPGFEKGRREAFQIQGEQRDSKRTLKRACTFQDEPSEFKKK